METEKLRDWLEIVGIFLVVVSLAFLGLEMRQSHKISLSQAYQSRTTSAAEWNYELAANPVALSGFRKAREGRDDEITQEENDAVFRMVASVLYLYDNAHFQYQEGFVSEGFWLGTRTALKRFMAPPTINAIVMARLEVQGRPEFRSVVRTLNDELRAEAVSESPPAESATAQLPFLATESAGNWVVKGGERICDGYLTRFEDEEYCSAEMPEDWEPFEFNGQTYHVVPLTDDGTE